MARTPAVTDNGYYPGHLKATLFEFLRELKDIDLIDSKIDFMQSYAKTNESKKQMMHIFTYLLTSEVAFDLPIGKPYYVEFNSIPENGQKLELLLRKVGYFLIGNDQKIQNAMKREKIFVRWLETVNAREAEILVAVKDRDFKFLGVDFHLLQKAYPGWCPLAYAPPERPANQVMRDDPETIRLRQEADFATAEDELAAINDASTIVSREETTLEVPSIDPKDLPVVELEPTIPRRGNFKKGSKSGGKTANAEKQ